MIWLSAREVIKNNKKRVTARAVSRFFCTFVRNYGLYAPAQSMQ